MESFLNRLYGFDALKIEHRKHLRFALSLPATCLYDDQKPAQECKIVDISERGLGFELDGQVSLKNGQNVMLSIFPPERRIPVSAIVQVQWIKNADEPCVKQRVGCLISFLDPTEKAHLMQYAHAMKLVGVVKNSFIDRALALKYPRYRPVK